MSTESRATQTAKIAKLEAQQQYVKSYAFNNAMKIIFLAEEITSDLPREELSKKLDEIIYLAAFLKETAQ